ncbi:MAG: GNAT family N-acetyltransferase [Pseudomonadota bacterium]
MVCAAPRLETARLVLREYRRQDFEAFSAYYASPRSKFTDGPIPRQRAWEMFAAGSGRWPLVGYGAWTVALKGTEQTLGLVSLNTLIELEYPELGYILWPEAEGNGFAFEAVSAARDFAANHLGLSDLVSCIHEENARSIRLAVKLGALRDRRLERPDAPATQVFRHVP